MMIGLDIMKGLQKNWWDIFRGEGSISTDVFFIFVNTRINFQMDTGEF